ncbi:Predicted dinucleotide-utilizing enzyme [Gemmobacter megaterium]|uniref:Predicted dinucleotide-utilizing enzyme n=1 Tax=Gemmobacter megaterium TaxID=1086013 RepID=A0A1N7NAM7_9RHOB|nr:aspartate dehydrogenase domain-containing protein [Gemmobacter megaterium]GGE13934.1 hypothetical protein GCM10011345_19780 [Gemmobacter megaterium]SIS95298.1 Predicted dinucleotide-utilizing enzyme [Gemmobacter megaterium]
MLEVALVGRGRIGAGVAEWLTAAPGFALQGVIGRGEALPAARLTIDAAGPEALRAHGEAALEQGDLWSVGAAALIDPAFRARLEAVANRTGHRLRLFTGWIGGPMLCSPGHSARMEITQSAPRLGPSPGELFHGPLSQAAEQFPDHLNTATAAALCGPGIEATTIRLICTPDGAPHVIQSRFEMPGQLIDTHVTLENDPAAPHPVAEAIIAALVRQRAWVSYG